METVWTKLKKIFQRKSALQKAQILHGCPRCPHNQLQAFIWPEQSFVHELESVRILRSDEELLKCENCKAHWVRQEKHLRLVEDLDLLERWNNQPLHCPENFLETLHQIGKTHFLSVPCSVELHDGQTFEACEVHFLEEAPIWLDLSKKIFLISEVKTLKASKFSLPQIVRQKLAEAWELRLGIPATAIKAANEQVYLLHGVKNFFSQDNIVGSEITELVNEYDPSKAKQAEYNGPEPVIVVADLEPKLLYW